MDLDYAIAHAKEVAERDDIDCDCASQHSQLADWLEELKSYRSAKAAGQLISLPQIKKGRTLYWIWGNEIMPVA